jgi:protein gp37
MTNQTKIEWCDYTINLVEGCQKVGPGCDFCYAEARNIRFKGDNWGPGKPRRKVKSGIPKLRKIQRGAADFIAANGRRPRVFPNSLSDLFDNAWETIWRDEGFAEFEAAKDVDILMLTKRIGNLEKMVPDHWRNGNWPQNVGLMITVVNQAEADRDIPKLLDLKTRLRIPWVGLSMEPLLGPVDLTCLEWRNGDITHQDCALTATRKNILSDGQSYTNHVSAMGKVDWIITGGESGPHARPSNPQWFRDLRDQCAAAGTPLLFKQWGEWVSVSEVEGPGAHHKFEDGRTVRRVGKARAGRLLDGREHNGFPGALT